MDVSGKSESTPVTVKVYRSAPHPRGMSSGCLRPLFAAAALAVLFSFIAAASDASDASSGPCGEGDPYEDDLPDDGYIGRERLTAVIRAVPNILSAVRLLLSFALYFVEPLSAMYLFTYAVCAATDPLDGFIARRYDARSRYGHLMDSLGDVSLAAAVLVTLVSFLDWEPWEMILIVAVAAIRVAAFAIGSVRFGRPAFVHSHLNKAAGAVFFVSPFLIVLIGLPATAAIAGIVCATASLEYLCINIRNREYDPGCRSVFIDKG